MITVNIDGYQIGFHDEKLDRAQTTYLISQTANEETSLGATVKLLDRLFEGGYLGVCELLDPVDSDPTNDELANFIAKAFEDIANLKNSEGSQQSPQPVSQHSEPTYKDTSVSISMMPTKTE